LVRYVFKSQQSTKLSTDFVDGKWQKILIKKLQGLINVFL